MFPDAPPRVPEPVFEDAGGEPEALAPHVEPTPDAPEPNGAEAAAAEGAAEVEGQRGHVRAEHDLVRAAIEQVRGRGPRGAPGPVAAR